MRVKFCSIDPSMSNLGVVSGYITDDGIEVTGLNLIRTKKSQDKTIRASSDTYQRCRTLLVGMHEVLIDWQPKVVFAELPTGSQSAAGMKSYGISICVMATINTPIIQVTPQEVKVAATGNKTASKKDVIEWAREGWPDASWLYTNFDEHLADACGAVVAGIETDQWKQVMAILDGQQKLSMV